VGLALWGGILDVDDALWDKQFDVVLRHAYLIAQIAGRKMRDSGGGTMCSSVPSAGTSVRRAMRRTGAAKAALMSMVKSRRAGARAAGHPCQRHPRRAAS
jgi:NAD(P)-dependent dehydrogenase (short-subunit alcohol dehydrogenase family)